MSVVWAKARDRLKCRGSFISAMMLNIAGIPPYAKINEPIAAAAELNGGLLNSLKSGLHSPSCGAAAGRSSTPTATVKVRAGK